MDPKAATRVVDRGMKTVASKATVLKRLVVEYVPIDSVKPNSYNPNRQSERDFELLLRSIKEDGFTQPVIVQRESREIVDGEHRWRAGRHMGMETIPVVFVDMSPEQMRISTLRHNRARGSEDVDLSIQILRDLRELGALDWAQDSLLLDDLELQRMLDDVPVPQALAAEEYTQGWVPTRAGATGAGEFKRDDSLGVQARDSATDQALVQTQRLRALIEKSSGEEKAKLEKEILRVSYRVTAVYNNDEAALVRSVLEPKPAQKIYELVLRKLARQEQVGT